MITLRKNMPLKHLLLFDFSASVSRHVQYCSSHMAAEDASVQHSLNSWQWYGADNSCRQGVKCWRYFKADKKDEQLWSVWSHPKCAKQKHPSKLNPCVYPYLVYAGTSQSGDGAMTELYWSSINTSHDKSSSWHREWTLNRYLPVDWIVCDKEQIVSSGNGFK